MLLAYYIFNSSVPEGIAWFKVPISIPCDRLEQTPKFDKFVASCFDNKYYSEWLSGQQNIWFTCSTTSTEWNYVALILEIQKKVPELTVLNEGPSVFVF